MSRIIFSLLCLLIVKPGWAMVSTTTPTNAATQEIPCLEKFVADPNFTKDIDSILKGRPLTPEIVEGELKNEFYDFVGKGIVKYCLTTSNLSKFNTQITAESELRIPFKYKDLYYVFITNTENLFDYIPMPTAFLIAPFKNKKPGDTISISDMPTSSFWPSGCASEALGVKYYISSAVNDAGASAFSAYNGKNFFIDFPRGLTGRSFFTGLVMASESGWNGQEELVWYGNYKQARKDGVAFAQALQGTQCGNRNLAVYIVKLDTELKHSNGSTLPDWARTAGGIADIVSPFALWRTIVPIIKQAVNHSESQHEKLESVVVMDGPYIIR